MSIKGLSFIAQKKSKFFSFVIALVLFFCVVSLTKAATTVTLNQLAPRSAPYIPPICSQDTWDIMLVIDNSNSMQGINLVNAKSAAITFVTMVLQNQKSQVGIATFDNNGRVKTEFTNNITTLTKSINSISTGGAGGTCLECAINSRGSDDVYGAFTRGGKASNKHMVVILSDGRINRYIKSDGTIKGSTNADDEKKARNQALGAIGSVSNDKGAIFWVVHYGTAQSNAGYLRDQVVGYHNGTGQYLSAPTPDQFTARYTEIANTILGRRITARVYKGPTYTSLSAIRNVPVTLLQVSTPGGDTAPTDALGMATFSTCAQVTLRSPS